MATKLKEPKFELKSSRGQEMQLAILRGITKPPRKIDINLCKDKANTYYFVIQDVTINDTKKHEDIIILTMYEASELADIFKSLLFDELTEELEDMKIQIKEIKDIVEKAKE